MIRHQFALLMLCILSVGSEVESFCLAESALLGQWSLDLPGGEVGWLEIVGSEESQDEAAHQVRLMWGVGSARPITSFSINDDVMTFVRRAREPMATKDSPLTEYHIEVQAVGDQLKGKMKTGEQTPVLFFGQLQPPLPPAPHLESIMFGPPIELFDGQSLQGWLISNPKKRNGWSARNGVLVNSTPKTDFSAYGEYGNLRTESVYEDFQLHIEYRLPEDGGNSGIYLRGMYEIQVTHCDSSMQGINGPGAVFGKITPTQNAGKPAGQWESYDITLVDRHVTVIHNGVKVIDNQPVEGCTGGAMQSDVTLPGPIYLQGDHTSVEYRNIVLRPRLRNETP